MLTSELSNKLLIEKGIEYTDDGPPKLKSGLVLVVPPEYINKISELFIIILI